jgi:hypothetical protein
MSITGQLAGELALLLRPSLEPLGFKYLKSIRSFRRNRTYGHDLIKLHVVRYFSDGSYSVSFFWEIRHDVVEEIIATLGLPTDPTLATANQNSYNVHPNRALNYPGPTSWDITPQFDWKQVLNEISRFVEEVVIPWLTKFGDRGQLRAALAKDDGSAMTGHRTWVVVTALDILAGNEEDLLAYFTAQRKSPNMGPSAAQEFDSFVRAITVRLPPAFVASW